MESPRGLGDPSLGGIALVLAEADLVVTLGKRIDFTLGFAGAGICSETCRWIVVDSEAEELERAKLNLGARVTKTIAADPKSVAEALTDRHVSSVEHAEWRRRVAQSLAARSYDPAPTGVPNGAKDELTSLTLCAAVQRHVEANAPSVVISDGGEFGQWAQAETNGTCRVINGPSGAIGGALCYAIAAKKAKKDATVFAFTGDGAFGFHLAEIETAVRAGTPFVVIIGNDRCWNAEHQIQLRDYGPDRLISCGLGDARYDLAVVALGGHGELVTEPSELDAAIERAIASGKPACVNVLIEGLPAPARPAPLPDRAAARA